MMMINVLRAQSYCVVAMHARPLLSTEGSTKGGKWGWREIYAILGV